MRLLPALFFALASSFLFSSVSADLECGQSYTIANEGGSVEYCYYDTMQIPTIGVGFNLNRADAAQAMAAYGLELQAVLADCEAGTQTQQLTQDNALSLFNDYSYPPAVSCADSFAPGQPPYVTAALADMAFGVGCRGLNEFTQLQAALANGDYQEAANQAIASKWCQQVKTRCAKDVDCLASGQ